MSQPVIQVEGLTHIYHPGTSLERIALRDVSLEVYPGECVGIVGETGSGKTTLVQHFNGLLKPSGGKVYVEGKDLGKPGVSWTELRRRVGLVFQYPEHQLFEETVFDDIAFVLRRQKDVSEEEIEARVRSAARLVGLDYERFRRRSPFELSSGEMRRVALAGALVQEPAVLILDEPTVGLDGTGREEVLRELEALHRSGRTIILVSHAVEEVLGIADRLVVMESGRVLISGSPAEAFAFLLQENKLTFLVPPIFRLFHELRGCGWSLPKEIIRVEEAILAIDRQVGRARLPSGAEN